MNRLICILGITFSLATLTAAQKEPEPEKKERNRSFDGAPLDPFKEGARVRAKELAQKNHQELSDAAVELADITQKLKEDVAAGGENVISAKIFDRLDRIEKLTKRIRDKARAGN
jgi:hypothetical protein